MSELWRVPLPVCGDLPGNVRARSVAAPHKSAPSPCAIEFGRRFPTRQPNPFARNRAVLVAGTVSPARAIAKAFGNHSFGKSFDPTIVRFIPICTLTGLSLTRTVVLPLRYHPSEPVENSFTS